MTIEEKLAKSLVDDAKGRVNEEIRTLKTADKPSQKVGLDVIDDEKIKKLVEFRKSIPQENLPLYKRELEKANARLSYLDYLRYTDSQFIPTKFHRLLAQIIQDTVEKVEKGEHIRICLSVPPRHGKGYPVDFPVLTTKGWKKHGELKFGDYVYNDKGDQVMVLANQKPYYHPSLKVVFSTGEEHIVTKEHLWKVLFSRETRKDNKHGRERYEEIVETQDIFDKQQNNSRSPSVAIAEPLKNKQKTLVIDPYVLGLWLGDGLSQNNEVVVSKQDLQDELIGVGDKEVYSISQRKSDKNLFYIRFGKQQSQKQQQNQKTIGYKWEFTERLNKLGVRKNKHIPIDYLLASENQRWELLRGLMDTDGSVDTRGNCEFSNTNKELAYNAFTLIRSLGIKATINEYDAKLYGRIISKKYRVLFVPSKGHVIFKIKRKQERLDKRLLKDGVSKYQYFIKSIEPVEDQFVSCITVEGGMYLAGKGLIPTHNSYAFVETLPTWFVGRNPDSMAILTAYNTELAEKFGDKNRQKAKRHWKELWGLDISPSQDNKGLFEVKNRKGGIMSVGITGGITGNGGRLVIVDDPYKNGEEAYNPTVRNKVESMFRDSVLTRVQGRGTAIIVIHTRWHEEDLIGKLSNEEGWYVINLPVVADSDNDILKRKKGELLAPELGFDKDWAERTYKSVGKRVWTSLYMGKPSIEAGNLFQRGSFQFYTKSELPVVFDEVVQSWDLAVDSKGNSDYVAGQVWGRKGSNHYLLKRIKKRMSFIESVEMIRQISMTFPEARRIYIEKRANGQAVIETLMKEIGGIVPVIPKESKVQRASAITPYFEAGNIFLPNEQLDKNIEDYIQEFLKFPNSNHDDEVDATTQYLNEIRYRNSGKIVLGSNVSRINNAFRGGNIKV
jgi:predicted phage terminase large subunit-like protein